MSHDTLPQVRKRTHSKVPVERRMGDADAKRFFKLVEELLNEKMGSPCWIWKGALKKKGYGRFWLKGKVHLAHRICFENFHNLDLKSRPLLHHQDCGHRDCVSPLHTRIGTVQENNREVNAKRRAM